MKSPISLLSVRFYGLLLALLTLASPLVLRAGTPEDDTPVRVAGACFEPHPDEVSAAGSGVNHAKGDSGEVTAPSLSDADIARLAGSRESWGALSFHYGFGMGKEYQRATLNYETPVLWSLDVGVLGKVDLTIEAGFSYWFTTNNNFQHNRMWQLEATPLLRWWVLGPVYIEGGVGVAFFDTTYFVDKQISTSFQFADQVGVGVRLTDSIRVSARYVHFSNGGIKQPNPGLNICLVAIAYEF